MKGKLLNIKQVKALKNGTEVWVETYSWVPAIYRCCAIGIKQENIITDLNGAPWWSFSKDFIKYCKVYEWIESKTQADENEWTMNPKEGLTITELCKRAYQNVQKHGFWGDIPDLETLRQAIKEKIHITSNENNAIGNRLMLIVSEVAEAQDGLRHGNVNNFKEELADVAIRLGDLCGGLNIDLEAEILKKMETNKNRPYKHGKAF